MNEILKFDNVSKIYKVDETITKAIDEVSVSIQEGDIVVVLGPSGSGKSTFLNLLSGIDRCSKGKILFNGSQIQDFNDDQLVAFRRQNLGFIFQTYNLISNLNVRENVELGKQLALHPMNIDEIITAVGLGDMKDRFPYQLSGGQQQRVSIARALVKNPKILFCDEPTGALDEETGKSILQIIQEINTRYGTTVIIITHNPSIALMANQVIYLNSGKIVRNFRNLDVKQAFEIQWA